MEEINKFTHGPELDRWIERKYPDVLNEYQDSDAAEFVDLWDWLRQGEHWLILGQFQRELSDVLMQEEVAQERLRRVLQAIGGRKGEKPATFKNPVTGE